MKTVDVLKYIEMRKNERDLHLMCWDYIEKLHADFGLSDQNYSELKAKISSKIAMCERSIKDHEQKQICYKTNEPCKYDCQGLCKESC